MLSTTQLDSFVNHCKKLAALMSIDENLFDDFEVHDLEFDTWNNVNGLGLPSIFTSQ